MFKCFICQAVHVLCQSLITHLRIDHSFYPSTRFKLVCSQDRCRRQFSTYSGFKKHLVSAHEKDSCQSGDATNSESFQANFHSLQVAGTSVVQSPELGVLRTMDHVKEAKKIQKIFALQLLLNFKEVVWQIVLFHQLLVI